jgi:hypothetical protein
MSFHRLLLPALAAVLACDGDPSGNGGGWDAEDLGRAVTPGTTVAEQSPLAWSADGAEIFFVAAGSSSDLMAVRLADGHIRKVSDGLTLTFSLFVADAGPWIYRTRWHPVDMVRDVLDRVPQAGGSAEQITDNFTAFLSSAVPNPPLRPGSSAIAYAGRGPRGDPDDARIGTRDTLYLHDLVSQQRSALGFGVPLVFSPDGAELAYDRKPCDESGVWNNPCDTWILSLGSGAERKVAARDNDIDKHVWWDGAGLKQFSLRLEPRHSWVLRNLSTGTEQVVFTAPADAMADIGSSVSQDGLLAAAWLFYPRDPHQAIFVVDLSSSRSRLVVVNRSSQAWGLAWSADGRHIAYVMNERIYVQDVPTPL